jgi:hypothetical protein
MTAKRGLLLSVALGLTFAGTASAANTMFLWGNGYGGWGGAYSGLEIPYFAAHPPVYYSYPVPRTYGYSPYAYLPTVMTPPVACAPVPPQTIENPYAPQSREKEVAPDKTADAAPRPLMVLNPYVDQAAALDKTAE